MDNKDKALSLIAAASFIGSRPEGEYYSVSMFSSNVVIESYIGEESDYDSDHGEYVTTKSAVEVMADLRKAIGGTWDKQTNDYYFTLTREIAPKVTVKLLVARSEACTPKVVGSETVEVKDYDSCPTKTVTKDIVEWDCNPILDHA